MDLFPKARRHVNNQVFGRHWQHLLLSPCATEWSNGCGDFSHKLPIYYTQSPWSGESNLWHICAKYGQTSAAGIFRNAGKLPVWNTIARMRMFFGVMARIGMQLDAIDSSTYTDGINILRMTHVCESAYTRHRKRNCSQDRNRTQGQWWGKEGNTCFTALKAAMESLHLSEAFVAMTAECSEIKFEANTAIYFKFVLKTRNLRSVILLYTDKFE